MMHGQKNIKLYDSNYNKILRLLRIIQNCTLQHWKPSHVWYRSTFISWPCILFL